MYRQHDGVCERALFVLDGAGIIRWSYVSPIGVNPRRRHSVGARSPHPPRGNHMTRKVATVRLAVPVGDQDHVQGPGRPP